MMLDWAESRKQVLVHVGSLKTPAGIRIVVCSPPNVVYGVYQDPHWSPQR
jgi:hypothetical protein